MFYSKFTTEDVINAVKQINSRIEVKCNFATFTIRCAKDGDDFDYRVAISEIADVIVALDEGLDVCVSWASDKPDAFVFNLSLNKDNRMLFIRSRNYWKRFEQEELGAAAHAIYDAGGYVRDDTYHYEKWFDDMSYARVYVRDGMPYRIDICRKMGQQMRMCIGTLEL